MIGIKIGDFFLETKGVGLSVTLKSPIFNKDDGSYVFNFTFPATELNQKLLGMFNRIETFSTESKDFDCQIFFDNTHLWNGLLKVCYGRPKEFEASIGIEKGDFNYEAKNKKLTEVSFEELQYTIQEKSQPNSILKVIDQHYPDSKFALFPVYNPGLFSGTFYDRFFLMNLDLLKEAVTTYPFLYSWVMMDPPNGYFYRLEHDGWIYPYTDTNGESKTSRDCWVEVMRQYSEISDRYNNNPADFHLRDKVYHFFTYFFECINYWNIGSQMPSSLKLWSDFCAAGWVNYIDIQFLPHTYTPGKNIVPFPYLCEVLKQAIGDIGFVKGMDFFSNDSELSRLCLVTMNLMDTDYGNINPPGTLYKIRLNEHLPDISVSQFFRTLSDFFNCSVIPQKDYSVDIIKNTDILHTTKIIEFSRDVELVENSVSKTAFKFHISSESDDWFASEVKQDGVSKFPRIDDVYSVPDLPDAWSVIKKINVVCWVTNQERFYITTFENGNLQWKPYTKIDADLIVDDQYPDTTPIDASLGYWISHFGWYAGSDSDIFQHMGNTFPLFEFPRCSMKGNNLLHEISFDAEYNPMPLKLMFYRGRKNFTPNPIANADRLPHGSADDTYLGNKVPGLKYSLLWDGANGIYARFWKEWIYWLNNRAKDVKAKKLLTVQDIRSIDWTAKYNIFGVQYFIKEIRFDIDSVIHTAEIDLVKY